MTDRTVREGGNAATAGRTVREGSSAGATLREGTGGGTLREDSGSPTREGGYGPAWLPGSLANRFEVVEELPTRGMEADLYVVSNADGRRFVAKVYRRGIKPKEEILAILTRAEFEHVVQLEEFGEEDGRWWELIEYIEHSSLRALIDQEGPRLPDATVRQILRELNDALTHLHGLPIEHRDLKPDNVLVRTREPIDLVLADFGIASLMDASVRETSAHRTISYAPPEAIGVFSDEDDRSSRNVAVVRTRWDYWSLGIILVEMLAGEHPFKGRSEAVIAHRLATQNVDDLVEGVEREGWRRLCRGLLRRDPLKRWGSEQVSLWLANERDPRLTVEDEVAPTEFQAPPIPYYGKPCSSPKELLGHLRKDWEKAKAYFASGTNLNELVEWLRFKIGMEDLADAIKGTDTDTTLKTIEGRTFSYIQTIAKFSGDGRVEYKGLELDAETVKKIAENASKGDRSARTQLLDLYENGIVTIAGKFERESGLSAIAGNWRDAVSDYRSKLQDIERNGARAPALKGDILATLLAAALPVATVVDDLRSAARRATTADAKECSWFRNLGEPESASVGALMVIPCVIPEAEAGAKQRKYEKRRTYGRWGLVAAGVSVLIGIFVWYSIQQDRYRVAKASIDELIPYSTPGARIVFPGTGALPRANYLWNSRGNTYFTGEGEPFCRWELRSNGLNRDGSVSYSGKLLNDPVRRFLDSIFSSGCEGRKLSLSIKRVDDDRLRIAATMKGQGERVGWFSRSSFDSSDAIRIGGLSAEVWAYSRGASRTSTSFRATGPDIFIWVEKSGDFGGRDGFKFFVVRPDGTRSSCGRGDKCILRRGAGNSYARGTYTLRAEIDDRPLAEATFSVN